jgi:signal transduction histidine kinase
LRLGLLLFGVSLGALLVAWLLSSRTVLGPFLRHVGRMHERQAVQIARQLEGGDEPRELSRRLELQVRVRRRPPRRRCREAELDGRRLLRCPGPGGLVVVESAAGWVYVRRPVDPDRIRERLLVLLVILGTFLAAVSWWLSGRVTRPLSVAVRAMNRMGHGELSHRLDVAGSPELRDAASAFNRMAERLDRTIRSERSLMQAISHELRTPLARLRLELELLRDDAPASGRLDSMERDLESVDRLLTELFTTARAGWEERPWVRIDLAELAREVALTAAPDAEITGTGTVHGDRPQLARVLGNLLDNARKYGGTDAWVGVTIDGSRFTVDDDGPGVGPEELHRVFQPFYRGQGQGDGWGLGLMIAKQVVELHGGSIEAAPSPRGGLRIDVQLPPPGANPATG